jgi:Phosphotransferase enzyme family
MFVSLRAFWTGSGAGQQWSGVRRATGRLAGVKWSMHRMLPTIVRRRMSRLVRLARQQIRQPPPVAGLPSGFPFDTLDPLCREHLGARLRASSYVHLSSWKPRGTYRLELTTDAGTRRQLIFKDERYSIKEIPALRTLPISPGPPEFAIYQMRHKALSRFLPEVYWSKEVERGHHFQYILEDLGNDFEPITTERRDLTLAVEVLLQLQGALREALSHGGGHPYLAVYDRQCSEDLLDYVLRNLEEYRCGRESPGVDALCRNWQRVVDLHQRDEFYRHGLAAPIHGDYDHSNVLVHAQDRSWVRVVDWEWAGIGVPHTDLAALLKRVSPDDEHAALAIFACGYSRLTAEEHLRLFRWCQLEGRLLDAGFIARQQMLSTRRLPRLEDFVRDAAGDALRALGLLEAAPRRLAVA